MQEDLYVSKLLIKLLLTGFVDSLRINDVNDFVSFLESNYSENFVKLDSDVTLSDESVVSVYLSQKEDIKDIIITSNPYNWFTIKLDVAYSYK